MCSFFSADFMDISVWSQIQFSLWNSNGFFEKRLKINHSANLRCHGLSCHPVLSSVILCLCHFPCKLGQNMLPILFYKFLGERLH